MNIAFYLTNPEHLVHARIVKSSMVQPYAKFEADSSFIMPEAGDAVCFSVTKFEDMEQVEHKCYGIMEAKSFDFTSNRDVYGDIKLFIRLEGIDGEEIS